MKTIEKASERYFYNGSNGSIKDAFKAGVEFAQRWIPVEEEPYPSHEQILVKTKNGNVYDAVHNSHDNKITCWWGDGIYLLQKDEIIGWRKIELL